MIYAGITVGPIVDTMMMTSTPGGLWCASYFFSQVTRDLCLALRSEKLDILTLPEGHDLAAPMGAAGTYHDRIYFCAELSEDEASQRIESAIKKALNERAGEIATALGVTAKEAADSLNDIMQIHYTLFTDSAVKQKGIAKTLADALDALELVQNIKAEQSDNILRRLLRGTQDEANIYIKKYPALLSLAASGTFPLVSGNDDVKLRDISSIARGGSKGKAGKYFAIVQCDGDNMGKVIGGTDPNASLESQAQRIRDFSGFCMEYTTKATAQVNAFGGVVIYAGGDDLLFLAPIYGNDNENVWSLCKNIGETFNEVFKESRFGNEALDPKPSLSFGLSVNYIKFPLYEAFDDARALLFGKAKGFGSKNNVAVKLHKHSGQAAGFVCHLASGVENEGVFDSFLNFLKDFVDKASDSKAEDQLIHSVLYHLENQHSLFDAAMELCEKDGGTAVQNAFVNAFDNAGQAEAAKQNERLAELAIAIASEFKDGRIKGIGQKDDGKAESRLYALTSMLRTIKFLTEEG